MTYLSDSLREVQDRLKRLGLYRDVVDGDYGPNTHSAIIQAIAKLEIQGGLPPVEARTAPPAAPRSPSKLPAAYAWIETGSPLPRHLAQALACYGTLETAGAANNPTIMSWRDQLKAAGCAIVGYSGDAVPWCGLFMAYAMMMAGRVDEVVEGPLWALNWSKFGVDGGQPELGDILTFKREGGGHVALYIAEDPGHYHVLGGNQSDSVSIMRIAKTRMHACRQPRYTNKPASVRPVLVSAGGAPISRNEA